METSLLIPTNDMSRYVNDIVETIPDTEFDEFSESDFILFPQFEVNSI